VIGAGFSFSGLFFFPAPSSVYSPHQNFGALPPHVHDPRNFWFALSFLGVADFAVLRFFFFFVLAS